MSYVKRDWDNTGNEVTKEDFKRIENGIGYNEQEITNIKDGNISGSLQQQINVLNGKEVTITLASGCTQNATWPSKAYLAGSILFFDVTFDTPAEIPAWGTICTFNIPRVFIASKLCDIGVVGMQTTKNCYANSGSNKITSAYSAIPAGTYNISGFAMIGGV